jgi:hypothetical protein
MSTAHRQRLDLIEPTDSPSEAICLICSTSAASTAIYASAAVQVMDHAYDLRKTAADAYFVRMFTAFEFCLPTNANKVRADVRPDFNRNRQPVSVMGYR